MSAPKPLSPLAHALGQAHGVAPHALHIVERHLQIVQVTASKGRESDVAARVKAALGVELPPPGRASCGDKAGAIWVQPNSWLLTAPWSDEGDLHTATLRACGDAAAVVEQTHGKAVLHVSGADARELLSKGCRVDLHPRVFQPGSAAVTPIAHINAVIVQADAVPSYDLVLPASFAETFFEWLEMSAGEFGYAIGKGT